MKFLEKVKGWNKKTVAKVVGALFVGMFMGAMSTPLCSDSAHEGVEKKVSTLETSITKKDEEIKTQKSEIQTLSAKVEDAQPWFKMGEEEQRKIDEENKRIEAEKKAEEERKAEEARIAEEKRLEEERIAKENAEKNKYETGITYDQLARTPDDYMAKLCKFKGKVIQVMEGDGVTQIRLAVGGDYDKVVLAEFSKDTVSTRVLKDDNITIYGMSMGLFTYTSTMGGEITIPSMLVSKIDQ